MGKTDATSLTTSIIIIIIIIIIIQIQFSIRTMKKIPTWIVIE